jgi:predicted amidohydrolase YtcJ
VRGGRVIAVGAARDVRALAGPRATRIDCAGAAILPGLIDPHLHLFALAARHAHLDCRAFADLATLLDAVAARARGLAPGVWVRGDGLDERALGRLPTAAELESAAPRNPVRLRHRSLHASVLSASGCARLGEADPSGLVAAREEEIGRLVGPLPAAAIEAGLIAAGRELAALGLTTVADATPRRPDALAPLRAVMAARGFPLRVFAMRPPGTPAWRPRGGLAAGPVKIVVHEEGSRLRPDPATLARRVAVAARAGEAVAVHCLGAPTLVAALAAFEALPRALRSGRAHRLEHVAECPPPLVARIARSGLFVVTNPSFIHFRGDAYRDEVSRAAHSWLYRARTLAAAGVRLAAASDAPVVSPSPWIGIAAARTRRTAAGHVLGGRERLRAPAALDLYTTGAAAALGATALGRVFAGGPADLAVVEPDPLAASPDEVAGTRVLLTMVGGEVVWST